MFEANRAPYEGAEKAKVLKAVLESTQEPQDAVEYAIRTLNDSCIWSVDTGFDKRWMAWHTQYNVDVGGIEVAKRSKPEQVSNDELAEDALKLAAGRKTIDECSL